MLLIVAFPANLGRQDILNVLCECFQNIGRKHISPHFSAATWNSFDAEAEHRMRIHSTLILPVKYPEVPNIQKQCEDRMYFYKTIYVDSLNAGEYPDTAFEIVDCMRLLTKKLPDSWFLEMLYKGKTQEEYFNMIYEYANKEKGIVYDHLPLLLNAAREITVESLDELMSAEFTERTHIVLRWLYIMRFHQERIKEVDGKYTEHIDEIGSDGGFLTHDDESVYIDIKDFEAQASYCEHYKKLEAMPLTEVRERLKEPEKLFWLDCELMERRLGIKKRGMFE